MAVRIYLPVRPSARLSGKHTLEVGLLARFFLDVCRDALRGLPLDRDRLAVLADLALEGAKVVAAVDAG